MEQLNQQLRDAKLRIRYNVREFNGADYRYVTRPVRYEDVEEMLADIAKDIQCRSKSLQIKGKEIYKNDTLIAYLF